MTKPTQTLKLQGLTIRQRALADVVWHMDSVESVLALRESLKGDHRRDLDLVMQLIIMAQIDQDSEQGPYTEALEVIDSVR